MFCLQVLEIPTLNPAVPAVVVSQHPAKKSKHGHFFGALVAAPHAAVSPAACASPSLQNLPNTSNVKLPVDHSTLAAGHPISKDPPLQPHQPSNPPKPLQTMLLPQRPQSTSMVSTSRHVPAGQRHTQEPPPQTPLCTAGPQLVPPQATILTLPPIAADTRDLPLAPPEVATLAVAARTNATPQAATADVNVGAASAARAVHETLPTLSQPSRTVSPASTVRLSAASPVSTVRLGGGGCRQSLGSASAEGVMMSQGTERAEGATSDLSSMVPTQEMVVAAGAGRCSPMQVSECRADMVCRVS